ncbi:MaoC family dehydratase [Sphingobium cloacae]|uniref:MaoC-like dehydratase n=1 Tax=Sphingobium cloacae TaxID=120107 RepID=A0A1E1EZK8_9SPHN|nr:MaoC family dehydratase [Sphingobium cloacae]BAV63697.1 MaoC-like dehydratase [Sphingobium cloacae]
MQPFSPQALLARKVPIDNDWSRRDTMIYALGVGAEELPFVYEKQLVALPTMAAAIGYPGFHFWMDPELGIDTGRIVHGETEVLLHRPLPVEGRFSSINQVERIWDKGEGKGAVVRQMRQIHDAQGAHIATVTNSSMLRGNGGFGGTSEGQPAPRPVPDDRTPDAVVTLATAPNQALLYRLSGDYNPLHIDPAAAQAVGFERPILHGLCTFGVAGRAILAALCGNDPARLRKIGVRFSSPVYPGETISVEIWKGVDGNASFRAIAKERGVMVLNNGYAETL